MKTIQYDKDGWVCFRYPYDLTEVAGEIDVDEAIASKTYSCSEHYAWRVVNGEVVKERYEETPRKEEIEDRIRELKHNLENTDYQAIKYSEGRMTEQEYTPIGNQRQEWRDEINQLEDELNQLI